MWKITWFICHQVMQSHMKRIIGQGIAQDIFSLNKLLKIHINLVFLICKNILLTFSAQNWRKVRPIRPKTSMWTVCFGPRTSEVSDKDHEMMVHFLAQGYDDAVGPCPEVWNISWFRCRPLSPVPTSAIIFHFLDKKV